MAMSENERRLLVTGTLDTSGIGGGPYAELPNVSRAFRSADEVTFATDGQDPVSIPLSELTEGLPGFDPVEPVVEPPVDVPTVKAPEAVVEGPKPVPAARKAPVKKTAASKKQAARPANS